MKPYLDMWEKAFDFKGRTNRKDFWSAYGINAGILVVLGILLNVTTAGGEEITAIGIFPTILACIYSFMMIIPLLSIQIRRFHDTGHSAALYIVCLVLSPLYIGIIIRFVFYLKDSDRGLNNWGIGADEKPEKTYTLWQNTDSTENPDFSEAKETFVDQHITESELPKKKLWLRNILILFGISISIFFIILILVIFF